jgi:tellurite resistance protein
MTELKAAVKRQVFVLMLDEARAIAALPKLLPDPRQRRVAMDAARAVARTRGAIEGRQAQRLSEIEKLLGLDAPLQKRESA